MNNRDDLRAACDRVMKKFPQVANAFEHDWGKETWWDTILDRDYNVKLHLADDHQREQLQKR